MFFGNSTSRSEDYAETFGDEDDKRPLNQNFILLETLGRFDEPTTPAKLRQDVINDVEEGLLSTAFCGLPDEFGE